MSGAKGLISLLPSVSIFHVLLSSQCALAHGHVCVGMQMRPSQLEIYSETHLRFDASLNDASSCAFVSFFVFLTLLIESYQLSFIIQNKIITREPWFKIHLEI